MVSNDRLQIGGWGDTYRAFIRFDAVGLPKVVTRATLEMMPFSRGDASTPTRVNVLSITSGWSPSTLTWEAQPSVATTAVAAAPPPSPGQWWEVDITQLFNSWQSGRTVNNGLRLDPQATQNNFSIFRGSRFENDGQRPRIRLEFSPPVPTPSLKLPLPGAVSWLVTTELGGYDCSADPKNEGHAGANYFSIDFSWRNRDATGSRVYSRPEDGGTIPVLAAGSGIVSSTSVTSPVSENGHYVVIDHDGDGNLDTGFSTRYLHLKEPPLVIAGESVRQGDKLGLMGKTGNASADHLHFGVRYRNSGSADQSEISYVTMDGWLLKAFQSECSGSDYGGDYSRYYRSTNTPPSDPATLPTVTPDSVVEPWTYQPGLSPGGWVSVYGANLAAREEQWRPAPGQPLPTSLGGTTVRMNGVPAVLSYASESVLNVLAPGSLVEGDATLVVERTGLPDIPVTVPVRRMNPAIYSIAASSARPLKFYVTAAVAGTSDLVGSRQVDPRVNRGARPGESIDLYVTGLGRTGPEFPTTQLFSGAFPVSEPITVEIGSFRIEPQAAVLVSLGLYLVRFRVPDGLSPQEAPIRLTASNVRSSDNVFLTIDPPQAPPVPLIVLESVSINPTSVTGGQTAIGTITLSGPAPAGGIPVQVRLGTQSPVPIRVAAGQRTATFQITTVATTESRTLTVTAVLDGVERTATLTVLPNAPASPFRDYEITIDSTMTIDGRQMSPQMFVSVPNVIPLATLNPSAADLRTGVAIFAVYNRPSLAAGTVTFSEATGSFNNVLGGGSGTISSGSLTINATAPTVGTAVTGTLRFSVASRNYSLAFTGRIVRSERVR